MSEIAAVSKRLIDFCLNPCDTSALDELDSDECRQVLPFLARLWLREQYDDGGADESIQEEAHGELKQFKTSIFKKLRQFSDANRIRSYLEVDFIQICEDVIKNLSARRKNQALSVYSYLEFESASPTAKILMISNMLLNGNIRSDENVVCKYSSIDYSLFDIEIYFKDLSDILCIIHAELGEVISLSQFIYTLLHIQSNLCVSFVMKLIANSIDSIFQVVDIILDGCTCSQIDVQRHKCLMAITSCWPSLTTYVISECIRRHCLPSVILFLARQENLISILLSIFQFEYDRNWFVQFLRSTNKNSIEKQSVDKIREDLVVSCYTSRHTPHQDLLLFKLYSGLRIFAGLKFNESELKGLVELILNTNEITVAVSFLLVYPPLYETDHTRIVQWLKEKFNQAQQSILLIAIYCSSHQLQLLNDYASNQIGFRFQLKSNSLNSIKSLFQQVFPDDVLINEYTRSLPITRSLNAKMSQIQTSSSNAASNTLGIYFLNQCIKTNSFLASSSSTRNSNNNSSHHSFDLSVWLFNQICECIQPIHPIIITLINNYVNHLFNLNIMAEYRFQPISAKLLLQFFKNNYSNYDSHITPKLLFFYYLLTYETKRRETLFTTIATMQNPMNPTGNAVAVVAAMSTAAASGSSKMIPASLESLITYKYPAEIFNFVPINFSLIKAKESDFSLIYPVLLRLVINMFTQLCQVEHCLYEPKFKPNQPCVAEKRLSLDSISGRLERLVGLIKTGNLTRSEANMFKIIWFKGYSLHGRKLTLRTASIVLEMPSLTYDAICSNPLLLLKSENLEIYKCGPLFEILLYIVKECLIASKNQIEMFIVENHLSTLNDSRGNQYNQGKIIKDRQDLKNSLVAAQDTAIIQVLLDLFLLIKSKSNELNSREIQCIVCSFIHQMFIDNTNLAELVHFQGYPKQLLPILVNGVPSMHICLNFIDRLLSHNDIDKQIFAINLAAQLCEKYPIVKTFSVAKLCINVSFTLLQALTFEERRKFFKQISSAIVIFYTKLPPLTSECMSLFVNAVQTKSIDPDELPPFVDLNNVNI